MKNILAVLSLFILPGLLVGCVSSTYIHPATRGSAFDSATKQPITGAKVVMVWDGEIASYPSAHTSCLHFGTATTDGDGNFTFPSWEVDRKNLIRKSVVAEWFLLKPGRAVNPLVGDPIGRFKATPDGAYSLEQIDDPETWIRAVLKSLPPTCLADPSSYDAQLKFFDDVMEAIESLPAGREPIRDGPSEPAFTPRARISGHKCLIFRNIAASNSLTNYKMSEADRKCSY